LAFILHFDDGLSLLSLHECEGPEFHVTLHTRIAITPSNQSLHGVMGISCNLIFGSVSNKSLKGSESNDGRSESVALIINNYFDSIMLPYCNAAAVRIKIAIETDYAL